MPLGLDYGLIAALCWGSTDVMATFGGRRLGSLPVAAVAQATSLLVALLLAIMLGAGLPSDPASLVQSLFSEPSRRAPTCRSSRRCESGPLAVVSPVVAAYGGLTVVLAVLLRGESLSPLQGFGAALATAGVVLTGIVFDGGWRGTRIVGRGVLFSLVAMLLFTVLTVGLATPIRAAGWLPVVLASRLANAATIWLVLAVVVLRCHRAAPTCCWHLGSPAPGSPSSGSIAAAGRQPGCSTCRRLRVRDRPRGRTDLIVGLASSFGPVVAVIVAVALWGERLRPTQWVGLAGILAGLVAVALP